MKTIWSVTMMAALLLGCGVEQEVTSQEPLAAALPAVFSDAAPEGEATAIPQARTQFKPGDELVLDGRIMGVDDPFIEGRGVFVLGDDATITSCDEREDDHCRRPWDACCDPIEVRAAGTATIQILDAGGAVLKQGLKGVGGLSENVRVSVKGTVAPMANAGAFVVNAQQVYVHP